MNKYCWIVNTIYSSKGDCISDIRFIVNVDVNTAKDKCIKQIMEQYPNAQIHNTITFNIYDYGHLIPELSENKELKNKIKSLERKIDELLEPPEFTGL